MRIVFCWPSCLRSFCHPVSGQYRIPSPTGGRNCNRAPTGLSIWWQCGVQRNPLPRWLLCATTSGQPLSPSVAHRNISIRIVWATHLPGIWLFGNPSPSLLHHVPFGCQTTATITARPCDIPSTRQPHATAVCVQRSRRDARVSAVRAAVARVRPLNSREALRPVDGLCDGGVRSRKTMTAGNTLRAVLVAVLIANACMLVRGRLNLGFETDLENYTTAETTILLTIGVVVRFLSFSFRW